MLFTLNESVVRKYIVFLAFFLIWRSTSPLRAEDEPARLSVVTMPGVILLDNDTLAVQDTLEIEITPGEHVLNFYPFHTADVWLPRYLIYPFTIGAAGHRTIDLTRNELLLIRSEPDAAILQYRGRYLGRTPGQFFLLTGTDDSVMVRAPGFQTVPLHFDRLKESGNELFVSLEPQIVNEGQEEELQVFQYRSPIRKLMTPELVLSFTAGIALVASGVHFNKEADRHYDRYLRLLGTRAREDAYSKMRRNDRLSKVTIITGDISFGYFGYILIRRFVLPERHNTTRESSGLSLKISGHRAGLAFKF